MPTDSPRTKAQNVKMWESTDLEGGAGGMEWSAWAPARSEQLVPPFRPIGALREGRSATARCSVPVMNANEVPESNLC